MVGEIDRFERLDKQTLTGPPNHPKCVRSIRIRIRIIIQALQILFLIVILIVHAALNDQPSYFSALSMVRISKSGLLSLARQALLLQSWASFIPPNLTHPSKSPISFFQCFKTQPPRTEALSTPIVPCPPSPSTISVT